MYSILLTTKDIGVELPQRTLFKGLSFSIARGDRIGLVGRNGEGKTTLLKVLTGDSELSTGTVQKIGSVYYLPQLELSLFERQETVETFVKERGAPWREVEASLHKLFGTTRIVPDKELRMLSGGELAKLLIAISDTKRPDVLLLDEPTNHLDIEGLEVLKRYLLGFKGAFVVISHDPVFLDHAVKVIWEIENGVLTVHGGNYSFYAKQKRLADEVLERDLEAAKKNVKQARQAIEARETRAARATRAGKQSKAELSRDKYGEGYFGNRSEKSAGKLKIKQERVMAERERRVQELKKPKKKTAHLDLMVDNDTSRRMLLDIADAGLTVGDTELLSGINLHVVFGDRVVFTGANGSGKSSLAKALIKADGPGVLTGVVKHSRALRAVYLDQKYTVVRPDLTLIENIEQAHPHIDTEQVYRQLGRFLFRDADVKKRASVLSGGEAARLALAMVTAQPIDLLVLDEPTNNLDIETLDSIADALAGFPGALIVISHNIHFLARLGIEKAYMLSNYALRAMKNRPEDTEAFYAELSESAGT